MMNFLSFSDSAKFADVARNLILGRGYGNSFDFWGGNIFNSLKQSVFSAAWLPPLMPFSIAAFFKIFEVNDFAVIATSFFYFILILIFTFLLAKKIFKSNLIGALSVLAVGFNNDLIKYAITGASEPPFIFEIVAASYFISLKKKWATTAAVVLMILMYFTRPQAFIYIAGTILFWLLNTFKVKKAILIFAAVLLGGILIDRIILLPLSGKMFLYSITGRGINSALAQSYSTSASDALRGVVGNPAGGAMRIAKNFLYNFYNFYKLFPQIMNPYLFTLFIIGLFRSSKTMERRADVYGSFKIATLFMAVATLLVTAASIPFFRYMHPLVPLIYIIAIGTLIEIINFKISKQATVILVSTFLVLFFGVGHTLGVIFLDSRFERNTHNTGKPPVYAELSKILKENTDPNQIVITNLDTWGSWYGERRTVWYPVEPKMLIDPATGRVPFDAIYLTSYLIDDRNYYMGASWREIFDNPNDSKKWVCDGCAEIAKEFKLKEVFEISADDDYERLDSKAVLLVRK